jgi:hypothetical protein
MKELRITECDGCHKEGECQLREGTAGNGDPQKALWFLAPPGWWSTYYRVPNGPYKGAMMIIHRCPDCIDKAAPSKSS